MNTNMSDITLDFVKNYMRIEPDFMDDDAEIQLFMSVAQSFLSEQTHRTVEELNARPSAVAPYLYAVSEFYDNRSITGANVAMNPIFKLMLNGLKKKGIL